MRGSVVASSEMRVCNPVLVREFAKREQVVKFSTSVLLFMVEVFWVSVFCCFCHGVLVCRTWISTGVEEEQPIVFQGFIVEPRFFFHNVPATPANRMMLQAFEGWLGDALDL